MTDLLAFVSWFLAQAWRFFTEIDVPGTGFSIASVFLGVFFADLGLRLLGYIFGFGVGFSGIIPKGNKDGKGSGDK